MTDGARAGTKDVKVQVHSYAFAYASLLAFVLIYFARPEDWIPGFGAGRPAFVAGGLVIVGFVLAVRSSGTGILALSCEIRYLVALFAQLFAAAFFSPVRRGGAFQVVAYTFSKIASIVLVIALMITTLAALRKLIFTRTACIDPEGASQFLRLRGLADV